MEKLARNPLFYTSLVLAIILGFQTYNLVFAWTPPAGTPPDAGNVAQPLDTGSSPQTKIGALKIGQDTMPNVAIDPAGQSITFNNATGDSGNIFYSGGKITILGSAASSISLDPINEAILFKDSRYQASIYSTANGLAYKNNDGVEHLIGTGTGTGTNLWQKIGGTSNNIYYDAGSVTIGNSSSNRNLQVFGDLTLSGFSTAQPQYAYFPRYNSQQTIFTQEGIDLSQYNFTFITGVSANSAKLSCDTDQTEISDCFLTGVLESASVSDPNTKYNLAVGSASSGSFQFSGTFAQVYDKVQTGQYQYQLQGDQSSINSKVVGPFSLQNSSAYKPRIWCDTDATQGECVTSWFPGQGVAAPAFGAAGGWPDTVYDWFRMNGQYYAYVYSRVALPQTGFVGGNLQTETVSFPAKHVTSIDGVKLSFGAYGSGIQYPSSGVVHDPSGVDVTQDLGSFSFCALRSTFYDGGKDNTIQGTCNVYYDQNQNKWFLHELRRDSQTGLQCGVSCF
ncbi:MAG: hypothetical protein ABSF47_00565 [Minisyncoccia bacterium]|jgi:hypothetical protein